MDTSRINLDVKRELLIAVRTKIPSELFKQHNWVAWRYADTSEGNLKPISGPELQERLKLPKDQQKLTKPFYNVKTGDLGRKNDPSDWFLFDDVSDAIKDNPSKYHGLGYVLTPDGPYVGIDLDDCRDPETKKITDEALRIVRAFNSYTEISPSGRGLKIIARATKEGRDRKNHSKGIEVYSNQYFTLTGKVFKKQSKTFNKINDAQEALDDLLEEYFPPEEEKEITQVEPSPVDADDEEIIKMALSSKNGEKFKKLFYEGDISLYGNDHSAADMALLGMLAFWTGKDRERMNRLFRSSKLYRDKWNRDDYRNRTINEAIKNGRLIYNPKGKEELLQKLHHLRINRQWEDSNSYFLYGAFLQMASIFGKYVAGEGIYLYASARNLNLGSNIITSKEKDFIKISTTWKKLQKEGLVKEIIKGRSRKASSYLLPEPSSDSAMPVIPSNKSDTHGTSLIPISPISSLSFLCSLYVGKNESNTLGEMDVSPIQRIPWLPDLNKKQKMVIEQIYHGRHSLEDLAAYFGMRKNNFKSRIIKPLLGIGLLQDNDDLYVIDEKAVRDRFVNEGGLDNLNQAIHKKNMDMIEHEIDGEEANHRRSLQKVDAYERGEVKEKDLSRYEKDMVFARKMNSLSRKESSAIIQVSGVTGDQGAINECR